MTISALVVIVMVLASASVVLMTTSSTSSASPTYSSVENSPCASPAVTDPITLLPSAASHIASGYEQVSDTAHLLANGSMRRMVLVMQPNTEGTICVTYSVGYNASAPNIFNATKVQGVVNIANTQISGSGYYRTLSPAPGVNITSNAASAFDSAVQNDSTTAQYHVNEVTVVYSVSASADASGIYDFSFPFDCPGLFPLAILGGSQTVISSNFPGYFTPDECPNMNPVDSSSKVFLTGSSFITGFNGMSEVWVTGYGGYPAP